MFNNFLTASEIVHKFCCSYTPQQNEVVEWKDKYLLEVTRALLFQMNIPKHFWSDAALKHVIL